VQECVDRINRRYQTPEWTPVRYLLGTVPPAELRAVYRAADVMLVTSLRDGMNLVAKEFVSCRTDDDGVLILSEFAGAAAELPEALIVNPHSVEDLARAMRTALTLDRNARARRMRSLRQQVAKRTVHHWVAEFTADLAGAPTESATPKNRRLETTIRAAIIEGQRLSLAFVYEESLVEEQQATARIRPDPERRELLCDLSFRSHLDLHIISAIDHIALGRWFECVPVTIWAEHGLWHRGRDDRRWCRTQWLDTDWMADLRHFLEQFAARTPGSFVEELSTGFAWHFGRLERAERVTRAGTLFAVLREAADAMGFSVTLRSSLIEIRAGGLSRERTIEKILAAGAALGRLIAFERSRELTVRGALTGSDLLVTVGAPQASADHVLKDVAAVRDVLTTVLGSMHPAGIAPRVLAPAFSTGTTKSPGREAPDVPSAIPAS
jgi:trehalose 6-phosphate synthase/phosphatase